MEGCVLANKKVKINRSRAYSELKTQKNHNLLMGTYQKEQTILTHTSSNYFPSQSTYPRGGLDTEGFFRQ